MATSISETSGDTTVTREDYGARKCSFLDFLGAAQSLEVDLLPITWQEPLDSVGSGGTAEIRQASLSSEMSFAFKRIDWFQAGVMDEGRAMQLLRNELITNRQPALRESKNFLKLEGICWDLKLSTKAVRPVLVFEKTVHGDLERFLRSEPGKSLTMEQTLSLCWDVALAVQTLHASDIIHADLKPANILVFEPQNGRFEAKLADFGHSKPFYNKESDRIRLPTPRRWQAPEYHSGEWEYLGAKRMETYSCALICLWLLSQATSGELARSSSGNESVIEVVQKVADMTVVDDLLRIAELHCNVSLLLPWRTFFYNALDITGRCDGCLDQLVSYHPHREPKAPPRGAEGLVLPAAKHFEISPNLFQLLKADYSVRQYVRMKLEDEDRTAPGTEKAMSACFQLAVAYSIGFGGNRDLATASRYLERSRKSHHDLNSELTKIKEKVWRNGELYANPTVYLLERQGFLDVLDYRYSRMSTIVLEAAQNEYERELADMSNLFGRDHSITMLLQFLLGDVLRKRGRVAEAAEAQETLVSLLSGAPGYGPYHQSTLDAKSSLAATYYSLGKYKQAETLGKECIKLLERTAGVDNVSTLISTDSLALFLNSQGKYKEALEVSHKAVRMKTKVLGADHSTTLKSQVNLVTILRSAGELKQAIAAAEALQPKLERNLGPAHQITLVAQSNLAGLQYLTGDRESAAKLSEQVLSVVRTGLGDDHPDVAVNLQKIAIVKAGIGMIEEAEKLIKMAIDREELRLGRSHLDTLACVKDLGVILQGQGRHKEAFDCFERSLDGCRQALGDTHPRTIGLESDIASNLHQRGHLDQALQAYNHIFEALKLRSDESKTEGLTAKTNYAVLLRDLGQLSKAESSSTSAVAACVQAYGDDHPWTLTALANHAALLYTCHRYDESEALSREVLELRKKGFADTHPDILRSQADLAASLRKLGRQQEAMLLAESTLNALTHTLGPLHPETIASQNDWGVFLMDSRQFNASEQNLLAAVQARRKILGPKHPDTLVSVTNLASLHFCMGRYEESRDAYRDAASTLLITLGKTHPRTMSANDNLSGVLLELGKLDEAAELANATLEHRRSVYPANHPEILSSYARLRSICKGQGKIEEAISHSTMILSARTNELGPEHHLTLDELNQMMLLHQEKEDFEKAIALGFELLKLRETRAAGPQKDVLVAKCNLANALRLALRFGEARRYSEDAMNGFMSLFGQGDLLSIQSMNNHAILLMELGDLEQAETLCHAARAQAQGAHGQNVRLIADVSQNLVAIHVKQDRLDDAQTLRLEMLPLYESLYGQDSLEAIQVLLQIGNCYYDQSSFPNALRNLKEVLRRVIRVMPEEADEVQEIKGAVMELIMIVNEDQVGT